MRPVSTEDASADPGTTCGGGRFSFTLQSGIAGETANWLQRRQGVPRFKGRAAAFGFRHLPGLYQQCAFEEKLRVSHLFSHSCQLRTRSYSSVWLGPQHLNHVCNSFPAACVEGSRALLGQSLSLGAPQFPCLQNGAQSDRLMWVMGGLVS